MFIPNKCFAARKRSGPTPKQEDQQRANNGAGEEEINISSMLYKEQKQRELIREEQTKQNYTIDTPQIQVHTQKEFWI